MDNRELTKDNAVGVLKDRRPFLSVDEQRGAVYKAVLLKTERLAAAIHLVTGLMDTKETIRWELRSAAVDSVNSLHALSDSILNKISRVMSLLEVGLASGIISQMNCSILKDEYSKLEDAVRKFQFIEGINSFTLSKQFLGDSLVIANSVQASSGSDIKDTHQQRVKDTVRVSLTPARGVRGEQNKGGADKVSRQELIVRTLKDNQEYTIKDIIVQVSAIDPSIDCSDKTIQRDLVSMVGGGILVKRGERRWSRYSKATRHGSSG